MATILLVSKPVNPPWNDSSKNLVRDLANAMQRHQPLAFTRKRGEPQGANPEPDPDALAHPALAARVRTRAIHPPTRPGFTPTLADQMRVLGRLLTGERGDLWHFFFAANPRSSVSARVASALRRVRTVQTLCSAPRTMHLSRRLLFADVTVTVSAHTHTRLLAAGVAQARLRHIPPAVPVLPLPSARARRAARAQLGLPASRPLVVYPGDLEFSRGAWRALEALADQPPSLNASLVMAFRAKTARAQAAERALREHARRLGIADSVVWLGETPSMLNLLGTADVVLFPAEDLYAKMDLPLALLEAMSLARPVVVLRGTPAAELAEQGSAAAVPAARDALAGALGELLRNMDAARALGARARQRVCEQHAPEQMAERYEQLYDELL